MTPFKFILHYLNQIKLYAFTTFGLFALSRVFLYLDNYFIASLFGFIVSHPEQIISATSFAYIGIYAALHFGSNITDGIRTFFEYRMDILMRKNILTDLFRHTHRHSSEFFATEMSGTIANKISRLISNTENIMWSFKSMLEGLIVPCFVAFPILFGIDAGMALTIFAFCVITSVINYIHCRCLSPLAQTLAHEESAVSGIIVDSIANARLVKNCAAFNHERANLFRAMHRLISLSINRSKENGISNVYNILSLMIIRLISLSIIIYFWQVKNFNITEILLALTYINLLNTPIELIGRNIITYQQYIGSLKDSLQTLYKPFQVTDKPNAGILHPVNNAVSFRNVGFSYIKGHPVFKNLNLNIRPNEKIGIVGKSGAGKSTLVNLLLRAYDPQKGEIQISQQNISDVTQFSLRQNIALIPQEPSLFNRTVMENIRFSRPKATDEEVYHAAKLAYIHDTIINLPNGYNSVVGEKGVKLSGGERQRIAIASAILKNTPILILDEATSALDSESETAVQKALQNIMRDKTVIAIAHRLSTLKNMDRIIVLDKGEIIEDGSPAELLQKPDSAFYHLYKLQSDGFISA